MAKFAPGQERAERAVKAEKRRQPIDRYDEQVGPDDKPAEQQSMTASHESEAMPQRVLVTGVSGQDGSYLAEQLIADGARVFGLVRPGSRIAPGHRPERIFSRMASATCRYSGPSPFR